MEPLMPSVIGFQPPPPPSGLMAWSVLLNYGVIAGAALAVNWVNLLAFPN